MSIRPCIPVAPPYKTYWYGNSIRLHMRYLVGDITDAWVDMRGRCKYCHTELAHVGAGKAEAHALRDLLSAGVTEASIAAFAVVLELGMGGVWRGREVEQSIAAAYFGPPEKRPGR